MHALKASEFFHRQSTHISEQVQARVWSACPQPDLQISVIEFANQTPLRFTAENDHQQLQFSCQLAGEVEVRYGRQQLAIGRGSLLIGFAPEQRFELQVAPEARSIELRISLECLQALVGDEYADAMHRLKHRGVLHPNGYKFQTQQAAANLANLVAEREPSTLRIYAATLEFLASQLQSCADQAQSSIPMRMRRQLHQARERLLADLSAPPTIAELAMETGLNQLKLKKGFKQQFGDSIYRFFLMHRMERARELLHDHSVTDAAIILGYSNISHFSNAFRKQFGVLPGEMKRSF